jgi:myo-inositol 2-dehydrogenase / D-chiro-inositol 1-dehydrogenase
VAAVTVNIGIIGVGMIGQDHAGRLASVLSGARVAAVADADVDRAAAVARSLPGAQALASGHEVIGSETVDAVVVTSWGPTHEEFVLAAIEAGKPVFCEKPLAPAPDACLRIVEAEMAAGRRLVQVGFMRRYDRGYRALKRAVDDGVIGAPLLVHCAHRNPAVPETFTSDMPVTDAAVHEMDISRWLLGDEVAAVSVLAPRRTRHAATHLQDPQVLLMETAAGVHIDVEVFVNCQYGYDIRCELVGETGTVSLANPAPVAVRGAGSAAEPVPADWRERFAGAYDTELQEWVNSVRAGQATGPSSWDGYAVAAVSGAALTALESGQRTVVVMKDRPPFYS